MIDLNKLRADAESSMSQSTYNIEIYELLALCNVVEAAIKHCAGGHMPKGFTFTQEDEDTYSELDLALRPFTSEASDE